MDTHASLDARLARVDRWHWEALAKEAGGMLDQAFSPDRGGATMRYGDAGSAYTLRRHAKVS